MIPGWIAQNIRQNAAVELVELINRHAPLGAAYGPIRMHANGSAAEFDYEDEHGRSWTVVLTSLAP